MTTWSGRDTRIVSLTRRLIAAALLLLAASVIVTSHAALDAFEDQVKPEIGREAAAIGRTIAGPIERALSLGVPFADLGGVPDYLAGMLPGRPGISYLVLTDSTGKLVHGVGPTVAHFVPVTQTPAIQGGALPVRSTALGYDTSLPLRDEAGSIAGWLHVGMSREPLDVVVRDARWDVAIVLLVSMLLAVEILRFVADRAVSAPGALMETLTARLSSGSFVRATDTTARDEAGRLASAANVLGRRFSDRWDRLTWLARDVSSISAAAAARAGAALAEAGRALRFRSEDSSAETARDAAAGARLTLFLFAMAEQLSTSFIPLFGLDLARGSSAALGPDLLAALPIATFVAAVALATPIGGRLAARQGSRRSILIGAVPVVAGFVGCAFASNVYEFAIGRALCGAGYAIVTISCQLELARAAPAGRVARSLGGFTGAVMTGAVCGTAIGAVLADRFGYAATFLFSAFLIIIVQLVAARCVASDGGGRQQPSASMLEEAGQAIRTLPFMAMVVLVAIPAKLVLGGFVFYAAPLALRELGFSQPAIGRVVMLYGLFMLPAIALGAWLSDRARMGCMLMVTAGALSGVVLMLPFGLDMGLALPVAVATIGALQGLASAPMLALAPALAKEPGAPPVGALMAFLRLAERIGSVAGPMIAAYAMTVGGTAAVMLVLGVASLLAALAYAASFAARGAAARSGMGDAR